MWERNIQMILETTFSIQINLVLGFPTEDHEIGYSNSAIVVIKGKKG